MRLTLRTLLAYLDDTLEPSEIKQIGQKVAESDHAQELVARIKQVTRKRRLTTPPLTGPNAKFDANLIAEYLDDALPGEQVIDIEKICLESDVHLAEIAACHQILTLVLGEPALVPPTARERMYGLVKGREAIPFRKAPARPLHGAASKYGDDEETAILGLPVRKRHASWLKWAIPLAGLFLFLALGAALYSALGGNGREPLKVANNDKPNLDKQEANKDKDGPPEKLIGDKPNKDGSTDSKPPDTVPVKPSDQQPMKPPDTVPMKPPDTPPMTPVERPAEPSKDRIALGTYQGSPRMGAPSILVARQPGQEVWKRVEPNKQVFSTDALVSLPGYASEVRTDSGVHLLLWGTLPEFNVNNPAFPFLFECAVTLHANPKVDLEFTLERGRVYVSNHKDTPALVRLRFQKEIWDLTLQERDTEVGIELIKRYTPEINYQDGEEPRADLSLYIVKGKAGLKYDNYNDFPNLQGPTGPAFFYWDNKGTGTKGPNQVKEPIVLWAKEIPVTDATKELRPTLDNIAETMTSTKPVDVMLLEGIKTAPRPSNRQLCTYDLAAIDAVSALLDILGNEDPRSAPEREAAIFALRRWISRGPQAGKELYDAKASSGLLLRKNYRTPEAVQLIALLHDFNDVDRKRPETFEALANYLQSGKMAIRSLAYFHLKALAWPPPTEGLPAYDPTWSAERRERASNDWKELVKHGKLPPAPPPMPPK